jgi:putative FmdB family regulatory protein
MIVYTFRCSSCGAFDERMRMGTAPPVVRCPTCGTEARRVWSAPRVVGSSPASRARAAEERLNDRPRVVTAQPSRPSPSPLTDPRQRRLPRP